MKTYPTCFRAAMPAFFSLFFFALPASGQCQGFETGAMPASLSVSSAYQSALLSWTPANFPADASLKAGYLIIYSTSQPSLVTEPNGMTPDYAVLNGTIVPTTQVLLPNQPATSAVATGLSDGTSYHFMIVAFIWDGADPATYKYSAAAQACLPIRPDAPGGIVLPPDSIKAYSIGGSFDLPMFQPDGYLVAYSSSPLPFVPENGHYYQPGETTGEATVALMANMTFFSTLGSGRALTPATTYHIYAFSYTLSECDHLPAYSAIYVTDSASTLAAPTGGQTISKATMRIVQDPVYGDVALESTSASSGMLGLMIYSSDGRQLLRTTMRVEAGTTPISLQTTGFPGGAYFIRALMADGSQRTLPFFKQ